MTLDELWDSEYDDAISYATRALGDYHAAEEVVSSAFLKASKLLDRPDPAGLLRTIVFGRVIDEYRARAARPKLAPPQDSLGTAARDQPFVVEILDGVIRELPKAVRDAWILTHLRGLTTREAGEILGVSHVTVLERNVIANSRLQEEL